MHGVCVAGGAVCMECVTRSAGLAGCLHASSHGSADFSGCRLCSRFCCRSSFTCCGSCPGSVPCSSAGAGRACSCPFLKGWYRAGRVRCGTIFVGSYGCCSVDFMVWVRGVGLCLPWMCMVCVMSLFPSVWLVAFVSPGRLLVCLGVGILKFAHPCARGDFCSAEFCCRSSVAKRGRCPCSVPCSSPGTERACSCPSLKGWYRASRARRLGLSRAFFVGPCGCCSADLVAWGVGLNRGGGLCLPLM